MQGLLSRAEISPMWGTYDPLLNSGLHSPRQLASLAAWYDASDLSSFIYDGSNRVSLWADKSGNSNVNVLALNGVSGNYASSPDSAPLSITGDIEIVVRCAPVSWAPASINVIANKYSTAPGNRSYLFYINTTGKLHLDISTNGTAVNGADSSVATGFSAFSQYWIKVTYRTSDQRTQFFYATDQSTEPSVWTQLGTDLTIAGVTTIFDSNVEFQIGISGGANFPFSGNIYRTILRNGIAGTLVFDANFATAAKLATTFTESSANAATVTINTIGDLGARICGARDLYQGTVANQPVLTIAATGNYLTFDGSNDYMKAAAWAMAQPVTGYFVGSQVSWTSTDVLFDGNVPSVQIAQVTSTPRLGIPGGSGDTFIDSFVLQTNGVLSWGWNAGSSFIRRNREAADTGTGPSTAPNGLAVGANGTPGQWSNITASEILIYNAAHTTVTQDRTLLMEGRKWHIAV